MNTTSLRKLSSLDQIRLDQGTEQLKRIFYRLGETQKQQATFYINEGTLSFPSLFVLIPEIDALNLYDKLNPRNITAIKACAKIAGNQALHVPAEQSPSENSDMLYPVLKWMLKTGAAEDGLCNEYDKVMDGAASILIKTYQDQTNLPIIVDLIFIRNRKGHLIHDLVWCLFQARTPYTLNLIAGYLRSADPQDTKLARKLLHFASVQENAKGAALHNQYEAYLSWLKENYAFLYFTGESFQCTSDPEPWSVDLDAKYLCKGRAPADRNPLNPLTEFEQSCLHQFHEAGDEEKKLLSKYSNKMHNENIESWNKWMQYDLNTKIQIAKGSLGGAR
ncbi:hypothetical protein V6615_13740 [Oscillospiraceae bacterium PP1C4]